MVNHLLLHASKGMLQGDFIGKPAEFQVFPWTIDWHYCFNIISVFMVNCQIIHVNPRTSLHNHPFSHWNLMTSPWNFHWLTITSAWNPNFHHRFTTGVATLVLVWDLLATEEEQWRLLSTLDYRRIRGFWGSPCGKSPSSIGQLMSMIIWLDGLSL